MTGPEPGSDHRTVSTDQQSETLRLLPWNQADSTEARRVLARSGALETEGDILARHDRYLRGWAEGTAFFYVIELDGHCVGSIGYWYGHSRGIVAYEVAWSLTPDAPDHRGIAVRSMRLLVEEAAEFPVPRFVHAFVPTEDAEASAVCVESGFDRVDVVERGEPLRRYADWAFDLAAVA